MTCQDYDRELIELAAKAAGITTAIFYNEDDGLGWYAKTGKRDYWRPFTDDGDALRLAHKVKIDIETSQTGVEDAVWIESKDNYTYMKEGGDDLHSVRRAIVRAAAEAGRHL